MTVLLSSSKLIACGSNAVVSAIKYVVLIKKLFHNTVLMNNIVFLQDNRGFLAGVSI